ncbi:hypothetical protein Glove_688g27 [Diversispora epigaea]|uniref:Uncharacterized protein n=1 Tax=Diversispora epigaea TaxID=1348612 RepID=A0A397G8B2_9GLOM|nr:hypothetical protein Glove_688g27 [Diversispora epigaea]
MNNNNNKLMIIIIVTNDRISLIPSISELLFFICSSFRQSSRKFMSVIEKQLAEKDGLLRNLYTIIQKKFSL